MLILGIAAAWVSRCWIEQARTRTGQCWVHQSNRPVNRRYAQVGSSAQQRPGPLRIDLVGPSRFVQPVDPELDQQVTEQPGKQHARIEYRDSAHCAEPTAAGSEESHGPIKFGELVKCAVGASPLLIAVSERIGGPDAPVRPDPMGRQLPCIDQLDHEWAGNAQEIRNLLRGQVLPSTEHRGGFARGDPLEKLDHQRDGGRGERDIAHPRHPDDGPGVSLRSACRERPGAGCSRPAIGSARALRLVGLSGHHGHGTVAPDQTKQTKHNSARFGTPVTPPHSISVIRRAGGGTATDSAAPIADGYPRWSWEPPPSHFRA